MVVIVTEMGKVYPVGWRFLGFLDLGERFDFTFL